MTDILKLSFRKGKPFSAYLYLSGDVHSKSTRTQQITSGLIADYNAQGEPIGLEIISPSHTSVEDVNNALQYLQLSPMPVNELGPLKVA